MATKLNLVASPTFTAPVPVPLAGGDPVEVRMTFKHRTKTDLEAWIKARAGQTDLVTFQEMVTGWELEDVFTPENITTFLENYMGAAAVAFQVYVEQLTKHRAKN